MKNIFMNEYINVRYNTSLRTYTNSTDRYIFRITVHTLQK